MSELQKCVRQDSVPAVQIAALPTNLLEQRAAGAGKQNDHVYTMLARNLEQKSNVRVFIIISELGNVVRVCSTLYLTPGRCHPSTDSNEPSSRIASAEPIGCLRDCGMPRTPADALDRPRFLQNTDTAAPCAAGERGRRRCGTICSRPLSRSLYFATTERECRVLAIDVVSFNPGGSWSDGAAADDVVDAEHGYARDHRVWAAAYCPGYFVGAMDGLQLTVTMISFDISLRSRP
jgi:hypothetical protein